MLVVATIQVGFFTYTSERMTMKLRVCYFESLLSQDVGFFDGAESGTVTTKVAENSLLFREATGDKFVALFQFGSMFLGGVIVGFLYIWELSLVIIAVSPFLGISGYFMSKAITKLLNGQLESYARAGAIAEETFRLFRTVTAFGLQNDRLKGFVNELNIANKKSENQGMSTGLGFGSVFLVYFASYALAFYVGSVLLINSRVNAEAASPMPSTPIAPECRVGGQVPALCK